MAQPDWTPLRNALRACRSSGTLPQLWWRDDDAVRPTAALDQLAELAMATGVPVHLAVIPADASDTLAAHITSMPLIPIVHGWAHRDHSMPGEKRNEFLTQRADATQDAADGLARLQTLFGDRLQPMFVPPWNRIHADVIAALPALGYTALSTFGPRPQDHDSIRRINTHVDPIDWKGTRDLIDAQTLIDRAAAQLHDRHMGRADAAEPFGLLTHHLVHTPAIWDFAHTFLTELQQGGAMPWQMET
ncbi:MAG: polysaccharide deacetylase family protein [Pseudomonadota bacterium]